MYDVTDTEVLDLAAEYDLTAERAVEVLNAADYLGMTPLVAMDFLDGGEGGRTDRYGSPLH